MTTDAHIIAAYQQAMAREATPARDWSDVVPEVTADLGVPRDRVADVIIRHEFNMGAG
jgi:hypothetical protein